MTKKQQSGSGLFVALLLMLVLIAVGFAGYFVWNAQHQPTTNASSAGVSGTPYMVISKWGVKVPVSNDFTYTVVDANTVTITTSEIKSAAAKIQCDPADTTIGRLVRDTAMHDGPSIWSQKINGYYYEFAPRSTAQCLDAPGYNSATDTVNSWGQEAMDKFIGATPYIVAE